MLFQDYLSVIREVLQESYQSGTLIPCLREVHCLAIWLLTFLNCVWLLCEDISSFLGSSTDL
jgi:hypothetical protein